MATKEAVMEVLGTIDDPELKRPLTELDMVNNVEIDGGTVNVGITLTVPGCPLKAKIAEDVKTGVAALEGVKEVTVEFGVMTEEQRERLREKLGHGSKGAPKERQELSFAKRYIGVASGKGGVGKSTVTTNLACAMMRLGHKVGLMDADVYGFSIPRMVGLETPPTVIDDKIVPPRIGDSMQVVSMGLFVKEDEPVVWRGPMVHKMINQFLADVLWDPLDYFFMDLPPGTGDVTITIAQAIPAAELLVVTTPQATATHVAGRVAKLAEKTDIRVLGVVENMAYFEHDGKREYIFGRDGGKKLADVLGVPFLGEIPLMTSLCEGSDNGKPVAIHGTDDQVRLFEQLAAKVVNTKPS
ncbi:MAG: Mrp/NBP35 family ATP-binding protein [bacterium]